MTTEKRELAIGIPRKGAGIRQYDKKAVFPENVNKSQSPADKRRS